MESAQSIIDIIEAFFNALKTVINALKALLGMNTESTQAPDEK